MRSQLRRALMGVAALTAAAMTVPVGAAEPLLRLSAFAVNMGSGPSAAGTVLIAIERWSTSAERDKLINTFLEKKQDGLLDALQRVKPRTGYIRLPTTIGYDLQYAYQFPGEDGGQRLVIATDRRIGYWEARNQPRTIDYPFTLIEIHLGKDGVGEGKMSVATRVVANKKKNVIEIENYGTQPVRLQQVKVEK